MSSVPGQHIPVDADAVRELYDAADELTDELERRDDMTGEEAAAYERLLQAMTRLRIGLSDA